MVRNGDFVIELVAADTKVPFQEHFHNGETYVEVEPGKEYFIAIKKPGAEFFQDTLSLDIYLDGVILKSDIIRKACETTTIPDLYGTYVCKYDYGYEAGTSTQKALEFVVARRRAPMAVPRCVPSQDHLVGCLGKVEVRVYQAIDPRPYEHPITRYRNVDLRSPSVSFKAEAQEKTMRSTYGDTQFSVEEEIPEVSYSDGALLSRTTLYYCGTPGLVHVGVLPAHSAHSQGEDGNNNHHVPVKQEVKEELKEEVKQEHKRKRGFNDTRPAAAAGDPSEEKHGVMSAVLIVSSQPKKSTPTVDLTNIDDDDKEPDQEEQKLAAKPRRRRK